VAVAKAFAASGVPGLTVAIAARSGIERTMVLGVRRLGRPAPIEEADPFHLASMTKPMTATMIATLVDADILRWDETVAQAWPGEAAHMDRRAGAITLTQLLEHRSGLAAYTDLSEIATAPTFGGDGRAQRRAFAAWLLRKPPSFPSGQVRYSNAGYAIAAAMAEAASGASWETLMAGRVFAPLALSSCGFGWPAARKPEWPVGHRYRAPHFDPHDLADGYRVRAILAPAEDISCSASDLARFGRAWLLALDGDGSLVKPATARVMIADPQGGFGIGWMEGAGALIHPGGAGTFHGALLIDPTKDLAVAVIANAGQGRSGTWVVNQTLKAAIAAYGRATVGDGRIRPGAVSRIRDMASSAAAAAAAMYQAGARGSRVILMSQVTTTWVVPPKVEMARA
jgi:CubicO group peptidase (beta-lactamase class C family)